MKTIITFILIGVISLLSVSCMSEQEKNEYSKPQYYQTSRPTDVQKVAIITISVNGDTCEFVHMRDSKWNSGIAHWPHCKYCKK